MLTVTAPASTTEGAGTVQGTVTVSAAPARDVVVSLSSSDTTAVQVPATVVIPAGQTSANFAITIVDDNKIDGTHAATDHRARRELDRRHGDDQRAGQ